MYAVANPDILTQASTHLGHDSVLAPLITYFGICTIRPHTNYYQELVESIIGQQLSVKAAASIRHRFVDLFGGEFPSAEKLFNQSVERLREAGLSGAKTRYVQDIARHVLDGTLDFSDFERMSNEEIITTLTQVKGVGEWTAHMFLMFCMGRLDVLPVGDLGIRNGIQKLYKLDHLPTPDDVRAIAIQNQWRPYESVASWYVWQSLDNAPQSR